MPSAALFAVANVNADDVACRAIAVLVEHLEANQPNAGCNALVEIRTLLPGAGDRGRDMGAVAEIVQRRRRFAAVREVVERADLIFQIRDRADSRVKNRHAHAATGEAARRATDHGAQQVEADERVGAG